MIDINTKSRLRRARRFAMAMIVMSTFGILIEITLDAPDAASDAHLLVALILAASVVVWVIRHAVLSHELASLDMKMDYNEIAKSSRRDRRI